MQQKIDAKYILNKFCNFHTSCEISKLGKQNFCITGLRDDEEVKKTKSKLQLSDLNAKNFVIKKSDNKNSLSLHFSINPILTNYEEKIDEKYINFDEILLKKSYFSLRNQLKLNERFFDDENEIEDVNIQNNQTIYEPIDENTKPLDIICFDKSTLKYMKLKDDFIGEKNLPTRVVGIVFRNTKDTSKSEGTLEILSFNHVGFDHPDRKTNFFLAEDPNYGILSLFDVIDWINDYNKRHNEEWSLLNGKDAKDIYRQMRTLDINKFFKMYDKLPIARQTSYFVSIPEGWIGYSTKYNYIGDGYATYLFGELYDSYLDRVNAASRHLALMKLKINYSKNHLYESFIDNETENNDLDIVFKKTEFVDLGLTSGTLWATTNLGANSPEEYGLLFLWGNVDGYDYDEVLKLKKSTAIPSTTSGKYYSINDRLEEYDDAAYVNTNNYHIPTLEQIKELINETENEFDELHGIPGRKFTSIKDPNKWIFIPCSGYYDPYNEKILFKNIYGNIWSSKINGQYNSLAGYLTFSEGSCGYNYAPRYYALNIRAVY